MSVPTVRGNKADQRFVCFLFVIGGFSLAVLALFLFTLISHSLPSIKAFGVSFITGTLWEPHSDQYGALPFIVGTLVTSFLALLISFPFSLSLSLYIGYMVKPGKQKLFLESAMDLLAGIPSVIYGFWGLMVLVPLMISFEMAVGVVPYGVGIATAALVLALMIIPYSVSLGKEVIMLVPNELKEAAFALGATPMEVVRFVILPYASSGLFAGQLLSFGRAVSETMAVTMVIGNRNFMPLSIFDPANTLASVIANEFGEATKGLNVSSLIELALVLLLITIIINTLGQYIMKRLQV